MTKPNALSHAARRGAIIVAGLTCLVFLVFLVCGSAGSLGAAELVVEVTNGDRVTLVGAVDRWDKDGNPRRPVNAKAKIELPAVDATATRTGSGVWTFSDLPAGRYDLVILARDRIRIEGFGFPPVREFDPFFTAADRPTEAARQWITDDLFKSKYYENKVKPLGFAGNDKQTRALVQLLRDKPTSFDGQFGEPVATLRHEVWQYDHRYGAWSKEKRTRVLDRILMAKRELRQWTWVWDPALGDIQTGSQSMTVRYTLPAAFVPAKHAGLFPY